MNRLKTSAFLIALFIASAGSAFAQFKQNALSYTSTGVTFAQLTVTPPQTNGTVVYCPDCSQTTACTGGGTGAWAIRLANAWTCSTATASVVGLTNPLVATLNANNFKVTTLAPATVAQDALGYGQTGAALNTLNGFKGDGSDAINNFNLDSVFNVKAYGASTACGPFSGTCATNDRIAIQNAYNAACAAAQAVGAQGAAAVKFTPGSYTTDFPIITNCASPITMYCEGDGACTILAESGAVYPIIQHEANSYLNAITTFAPILATSLATGSGSALNWGTQSAQFYDLKDAVLGFNGSNVWQTVNPINGESAMSVEGYFQFPTGISNGTVMRIMNSSGSDINLPNCPACAIDIVMTTGATNTATVCFTTSGSGYGCIPAGGTFSAATVYEFEFSYDGTTGRLFAGTPGNTTTLIGSRAATGTIVQQPSETFALGDGPFNIGGTGNSNHWIGQLDSIRISKVARHTAVYTAPTAKFSSDSNTLLLLNNTAQSDVLLQVTNCASTGSPIWLPLRYSGSSFGTGGSPGNVHAMFKNLNLQGGSYAINGENVLYTTLDHITATSQSHYPIKFDFISYGTRIEHLVTNSAPAAEANVCLVHTNGLVNLTWLDSIGSYYGMELVDAGGTYSLLFMNPGSNAITDLDIGGSTIFTTYSIHEMEIDFESGGTPVPVKAFGAGSIQFVGGNWQLDPSVNALWFNPGGGAQALAITVDGGQIDILGTPTNPIASYKGTNTNGFVTFINPLIGGSLLSGSTVALCDNMAYCRAIGDVDIPPLKTVATLPTCNALHQGNLVQIKDCNTNCATYLGTTFTGGGSTRSTVQCNGTAWELH